MLFLRTYGTYLAWLISILAVGGSLFFSEVLHYEPCKLCWFQRIFMYPQLILLAVMAYKNDRQSIGYLIPLNVVGGSISLYHYAEQKIPGLSELIPCSPGVPCNQDYINLLGFITIPFLALVAFAGITLFLWLSLVRKNEGASIPQKNK